MASQKNQEGEITSEWNSINNCYHLCQPEENNMKSEQFKTEQLSTQTFSPDKIRSIGHQNFSTILLASWEI